MTTRRIFRESALQRYNNRLEKVDLPRYATTPWTVVAWASGALLLLFAALLLAVRMPVYAGGPGVVVPVDGRPTIAVLLPAEYAAKLRPGQPAQVTLPPDGSGRDDDYITATVTAVEPRPLSPAAARSRYTLDAATGSLVDGPVAVALLTLDRPAKLWAGSVGEARVEIGSRSGLALLPGIGRLFAAGEDAE